MNSGFAAVLVVLFSVSVYATKLKPGQTFPAATLKKLGAKTQSNLKEYKGKVVVVDFWASWCEPCKKEVPALNALYKKYLKKGVMIVGVNVDDEESTAKDFLKENHVDFPLFHDDGKKLAGQCDLSTMPSSFVIDKKGVIRFIHSGYKEGDPAKFEQEIKSIL